MTILAAAAAVEALLARLDEVIASDTLRAALLPRAPHVVPQLMKTLRDEGYMARAGPPRCARSTGSRRLSLRAADLAHPSVAAEVGRHGLAAVQSPLGDALRLADRLAMLHALAPRGHAPASIVPEWETLAASIQASWVGLPAT